MTDETTARIRELNDTLRCTGAGGERFITQGVAALGVPAVADILRHVAQFDNFSEGDDPHGEHDFGMLTLESRKIMWKINYYDLQYKWASDDPADPSVTRRILTIMLAEEY